MRFSEPQMYVLFNVKIKYNNGKRVKLKYVNANGLAELFANRNWPEIKSYKITVMGDKK